jgi:hypothetical protein
MHSEEFASAKCDWNKYGFVKEYGFMYYTYCVGYFIKWTEVQNLEYLSDPSRRYNM